MAGTDSRNAGGGRKFASLADTPKPQIASPINPQITAPLLSRRLERIESGRAEPAPLRLSKVAERPPLPNPPLKALSPQTQQIAPLKPFLPPTVATVSSLSPSTQMTTLAAATLIPQQRESLYRSQSLEPEAGDYSVDPQIILPEHRFLTPSEL